MLRSSYELCKNVQGQFHINPQEALQQDTNAAQCTCTWLLLFGSHWTEWQRTRPVEASIPSDDLRTRCQSPTPSVLAIRFAADSGGSRPRDVTPKVCPAGKVLPSQHASIQLSLVQPARLPAHVRHHAGNTSWVNPPVEISITADQSPARTSETAPVCRELSRMQRAVCLHQVADVASAGGKVAGSILRITWWRREGSGGGRRRGRGVLQRGSQAFQWAFRRCCLPLRR